MVALYLLLCRCDEIVCCRNSCDYRSNRMLLFVYDALAPYHCDTMVYSKHGTFLHNTCTFSHVRVVTYSSYALEPENITSVSQATILLKLYSVSTSWLCQSAIYSSIHSFIFFIHSNSPCQPNPSILTIASIHPSPITISTPFPSPQTPDPHSTQLNSTKAYSSASRPPQPPNPPR